MKTELHVPRIRWRRQPTAAVRLSVLIVGPAASEHCAATVASLEREWRDDNRRACDLEVLLASDSDEGIEHAWRASSGTARDIVAVVRDDVVFLEGSLRPLLERLQSDPDCGAVAPRVFVDPAQQLQRLPRAQPSAPAHLVRAAAERWAIVGRWYARRRLTHSLLWWTTEQALASDALPEACLFQRRKAIERASGLRALVPGGGNGRREFEGGEFCRRVSRSGYKLVYEPRSRVVHVPRGNRAPALAARSDNSVFEGGLIERVCERLARFLARRRRVRALERATNLGRVEVSPVLEFGRSLRYLVEVGTDPKWLEATGIVGEGPVFRFADSAWSCLEPGSHYLRAIDRDSGRTVGAWRFVIPRSAVPESAFATTATPREAA